MTGLRKGILVGFGNPLLDISATVDEAFLAKYGLERNNAILAEDKHKPIYQELIDKYKAEFIAGGSVQNSLRVAQWIMDYPGAAVFFGCVGRDNYARILAEKAEEAGVNVRYQVTDKEPTGTCAVLITGTQRSLCANLAAANLFSLDHVLKPENFKFVEEAEFFYISGFFLTASAETVQKVATHAFERNNMFVMNLSAPFLAQFYKDRLYNAFRYTDIVFGNELEAVAFSEAFGFDTTDLKEIALRLASFEKVGNKRKRVVIITNGSNPVILAHKCTIEEVPVPPLAREEIVDTNGAGDAFAGGFLAQLVQGKDYATCIKCGIWAAREIIKRSGCTFPKDVKFKLT